MGSPKVGSCLVSTVLWILARFYECFRGKWYIGGIGEPFPSQIMVDQISLWGYFFPSSSRKAHNGMLCVKHNTSDSAINSEYFEHVDSSEVLCSNWESTLTSLFLLQ